MAYEGVTKAAVVGYPHEIKGTGIYAFVVPDASHADMPEDQLRVELTRTVRSVIGPAGVAD